MALHHFHSSPASHLDTLAPARGGSGKAIFALAALFLSVVTSCGGAAVTGTPGGGGSTGSSDAAGSLDASDSSPPPDDGSANDDGSDGGPETSDGGPETGAADVATDGPSPPDANPSLDASDAVIVADAAADVVIVADAAADVAVACDEVGPSFSDSINPNPPWSFGWRDVDAFHLYPDHGAPSGSSAIVFWYTQLPSQPWNILGTVGKNTTNEVVHLGGTTTIQPGQLMMHPAQLEQMSIVRWSAPRSATYQIDATFSGIAGDNGTQPTSTDVHVFVAGRALFSEFINLNGRANSATANLTSALAAGDTIEFGVGRGNSSWSSDSTALTAKICPK